MATLSLLLHELIEHTVPAGNKRGELHAMVDELVVPVDALLAEEAKGTAAKAPAAKATVPPPALFAPAPAAAPAKSDGPPDA